MVSPHSEHRVHHRELRVAVTAALSVEIAPHDVSTTAMIRVRDTGRRCTPTGSRRQEPRDDERGAEEPRLEVAEVQRARHLVENARQDPAIDRVDERDQRQDHQRPASVPPPVGRRLLARLATVVGVVSAAMGPPSGTLDRGIRAPARSTRRVPRPPENHGRGPGR